MGEEDEDREEDGLGNLAVDMSNILTLGCSCSCINHHAILLKICGFYSKYFISSKIP